MPADRALRKLAELGAYGVNFHDNDVFDFDATETERDERIAGFRRALAETVLMLLRSNAGETVEAEPGRSGIA